MKTISLTVLIALILSLYAPLHINVRLASGEKAVALRTLDVCSESGVALSAQADIPCVPGRLCTLPVVENDLAYSSLPAAFNSFLVPSQQDRPPKA